MSYAHRELQSPTPLNAEWALDGHACRKFPAAHLFGAPVGGEQRSLCGATIARSYNLRQLHPGCLKCQACTRIETRRLALLGPAAKFSAEASP